MTDKELEQKKENILMIARLINEKRAIADAENSFRKFVKLAWPVIEPGVPYVHGRHIDAICDHLEAVASGDIRKLIISMPPRCMKSSLVSVLFLPWVWLKNPERKFLYASYDLKLAYRDSRKTSQLIKSSWYQKYWSELYGIDRKQDAKQRFDNTKMGYRVSSAVDAGTTGEGADVLCLPGDELVWTEYGRIKIEDLVELEIPCRVWSYNTETQETELKPITRWFKNPGSEILEIGLNDGATVRCTPNHKIWTSNRGWVMAGEILSDDVFPCPAAPEVVDCFLRDSVLLCQSPGSFATLQNLDYGTLGECAVASDTRTSFPIGDSSESLGSVPPINSIPDASNGVEGNPKVFRQYASALVAGSDLPSLFGVDPRSWPAFESAVHQCIGHIFKPSPIDEISESGIITPPVEMPDFQSRRARPNEGFHNQQVRSVDVSLPVLGEVIDGISMSASGTQDSLGECDHVRLSGDSNSFSSDSPEIRNAVNPLKSRDRKPLFVRSCDFVHNTYCITVEGNHNFLAGKEITPLVIANCYDDANDVKQMTSDAYIESVIYFHDFVMASRLNDPRTGARICVQQRCHERDITGHILSKEKGWDHLILPMEFEEASKPTSIGWQDWRSKHGELLWPERIGPEEIGEIKRNIGPIGWAAQFQQRPSPGEGAKFKREWWNFYNDAGTVTGPVRLRIPGAEVSIEKKPLPVPAAFEQIVHAWDMAFKEEKDSDFVVGHVWGRVGANVYLLDRISARMDFPKTLAAVRLLSQRFPCPEKLVEDKANGPAVIQTLRNEIPGLIPSEIAGGLESLATAHTGYAEAGNIFFPNPDVHPWVWDVIEQFAAYPKSAHDDDVAAAAHAWRRLFNSVANSAVPEFRVIPRANEPDSARHVIPHAEMMASLQPHWRRWIAVAPGQTGSALFFTQTPSRSLRIYRELDISNVDAREAGRRIAEASLDDIRSTMRVVAPNARVSVELLLEKECFAPIEPIDCYAELLEQGVLGYEPSEGSFMEREQAKAELKQVSFAADMIEVEETALDRLRDLLRFSPPDFRELEYSREESRALYARDPEAYQRYMAAVRGEVHGEYPKIKFSSACAQSVAALGCASREKVDEDPFLRAILIGCSAPDHGDTKLKEIPWHGNSPVRFNPRRGKRHGLRMAV